MHSAEEPESDAGATALAVVVVGSCLMVANAGDSRAVLSRRGRAIDLSRDHKPSCPSERERIRAAGVQRQIAASYCCCFPYKNGEPQRKRPSLPHCLQG